LYFVQLGVLFAYRDKEVVGVFVRFRAPLHWLTEIYDYLQVHNSQIEAAHGRFRGGVDTEDSV
jgi:hypothetical protein